MSRPFITALIGAYNQGRFIDEAIQSVLAQDFPASETEIIVVDDGSTDDTTARVKRYGDRLRYLRKPNGGQASAMNVGCAAAQGEIIAFLDGDDLWLPGKVETVVRTFEANPGVGFVYHALQYWDSRTNEFHDHVGFTPIRGDVLSDRNSLLRFGNVSTSAMSFRRNVVARLLPIPEALRLYADAHLGYLAVFVTHVHGLDKAMTTYRLHDNNLHSRPDTCHEDAAKRLSYATLVIREMRNWLTSHGFSADDPNIAAYLERYELVCEKLGFAVTGSGRWQMARHLRRERRLYGSVWGWKRKGLRRAKEIAVVALGPQGLDALRSGLGPATITARTRSVVAPARKNAPSRSWKGVVKR